MCMPLTTTSSLVLSPVLKLKGMESIYLQRLEPSAGRRPAPLPKTSRPRFRECTDRVLEDPDQIAEESIVKEQVEKYNVRQFDILRIKVAPIDFQAFGR